MTNDYHLTSQWRVRGTPDEVAAILREPRDLVRWWPEVYLDVRVEEAEGDGRTVHVLTRGFLPYTLSWRFREVVSDWPRGATIEAHGDLVGEGTWTLTREGPLTVATYDWRVRAEKPWLRRLAPLLKPLFAWNHRWAMTKGEAGLRRELERRRAMVHGASLY